MRGVEVLADVVVLLLLVIFAITVRLVDEFNFDVVVSGSRHHRFLSPRKRLQSGWRFLLFSFVVGDIF
jgi:hypothetical protein